MLYFDPRIWLQFVVSQITSDAGILAYRELDERLDLTCMAAEYLMDARSGKNIGHHLVPCLKQSIYSRLVVVCDTKNRPLGQLLIEKSTSAKTGFILN